jgi:hypothetical protein
MHLKEIVELLFSERTASVYGNRHLSHVVWAVEAALNYDLGQPTRDYGGEMRTDTLVYVVELSGQDTVAGQDIEAALLALHAQVRQLEMPLVVADVFAQGGEGTATLTVLALTSATVSNPNCNWEGGCATFHNGSQLSNHEAAAYNASAQTCTDCGGTGYSEQYADQWLSLRSNLRATCGDITWCGESSSVYFTDVNFEPYVGPFHDPNSPFQYYTAVGPGFSPSLFNIGVGYANGPATACLTQEQMEYGTWSYPATAAYFAPLYPPCLGCSTLVPKTVVSLQVAIGPSGTMTFPHINYSHFLQVYYGRCRFLRLTHH